MTPACTLSPKSKGSSVNLSWQPTSNSSAYDLLSAIFRVHRLRLPPFVLEHSEKSMVGPILSNVSIVQHDVPGMMLCGATKTQNKNVSARPVLLILHAYVSIVHHGIPVMVLSGAKMRKQLDVSASC